jgi:hypothetical protein
MQPGGRKYDFKVCNAPLCELDRVADDALYMLDAMPGIDSMHLNVEELAES